MSEERKKVLEMLAAGTITADEAERLLERLEGARHRESGRGAAATDEGAGEPESAGAKPCCGPAQIKFLRVMVDGSDGDKVNIRVPVALIRTGINLATMVPTDASKALEESGIDLSQLSGLKGEALLEALRDLTVDVDGADGETVRIFCE